MNYSKEYATKDVKNISRYKRIRVLDKDDTLNIKTYNIVSGEAVGALSLFLYRGGGGAYECR